MRVGCAFRIRQSRRSGWLGWRFEEGHYTHASDGLLDRPSSKLRLGIASRPRPDDWLQTDMEQLKREGVDTLISLLTSEEASELGLEHEAAACEAAGISFYNFSIPDRGVPESVSGFLAFARSIHSLASSGRAVADHCRACIGRSSVLLATVMRMEGFSAEEAFDRISQARGLRVPDTEEQAAWVARLPL
jgi:protein-tyrosine phosphatase